MIIFSACDKNSESNKITKELNGYEYVDLGLSVKWAIYNVGSICPEDSGNVFAWGECISKDKPYANNYTLNIENLPDDICNTKYDVVAQKWGKGWRMPTKKEVEELYEKCISVQTFFNGVKGLMFTASNGASIFFPEYDYYWISTEDGSENFSATTSFWTGTKAPSFEYGDYVNTSNGLTKPYIGLVARGVCK